MSLPIIVRPYSPETDEAFLYCTWLKSYASSSWAHAMTPEETWRRQGAVALYYERHREVIRRILSRPTVRVDMATWNDDQDVIVGWICHEPALDILHYVYVRETGEWRRRGIARLLLNCLMFDGLEVPHNPKLECVTYTHRSRACVHLPIPTHWTFDPYLAMMGPDVVAGERLELVERYASPRDRALPQSLNHGDNYAAHPQRQ